MTLATALEPRRGDWMRTFSGVKFYPLDPRPEDIRLVDIAHALANVGRFGGHTTSFYSVAQHSVLASRHVPDGARLAALLHDAHEAYLGDIIRPLKCSLNSKLIIYDAEDQLDVAIALAFGLRSPVFCDRECGAIKEIDRQLCWTEATQLMSTGTQDWAEWGNGYWADQPAPLDITIIPWPPSVSATLFLARASALGIEPDAFSATRLHTLFSEQSEIQNPKSEIEHA